MEVKFGFYKTLNTSVGLWSDILCKNVIAYPSRKLNNRGRFMVGSEEEKRTCKMKEYGVFLFVDDFDFINCPSPGWSPSCSPTPCSTVCALIGLYCACLSPLSGQPPLSPPC